VTAVRASSDTVFHPWPNAVALVAFFVSGVAGLVYEVCWIRQASAIFGATTSAASSVLAVFFFGIAVGSACFGFMAERVRQPLRLYVVLEVGIAGLALLTPLAFGAAEPIFGSLYRASGGSGGGLFVGRLVVISAILLPPTFLMGGTLPLLCREFVREDARIAAPVGWLYGINTLGALVGALVCGLWLLPTIGLSRSVQLGAALSLLSGATVLAILRALRQRTAPPRSTISPSVSRVLESGGSPRMRPAPLTGAEPTLFSLLVFATGFVAIGGQVLWIRFLALLVPNGVHAYTLTLAAVLLGIVGGSLLAARLADRARHPALHFGALQVGYGLVVLVTLHLPVTWLRGLAAPDFLSGPMWLASFSPCLLLVPPAILSGASFPLAVRLRTVRARESSRHVGMLTALNTLGAIAGSLSAGFWLLPRLGLQDALALLAGVSVASGVAAWCFLDVRGAAWPRIAASGIALGLWALVPRLLGTTLPDDHLLDPGDELVAVREGRVGNVAVVRHEGTLSLEIDRWWQGQRASKHQRLAAHLPMLLHPDARRVLVVGVGAGQTPGRFLFHPIERLDCVEIEPAVFDVVREYFGGTDAEEPEGNREPVPHWMDDPRVRLLAEDGRSFLSHTAERYDVISLELGQVFRPSVAPFYNLELYARARAHLRPAGIVSQFLPLSFFEPEELQRAIASFVAVFPESFLWYNASELLLLGFRDAPAAIDGARFAKELARPELQQDLAFSHWGGREHELGRAEVLVGGLLLGPAELQQLSAGAPPLRDDLPELEYRASARVLDPLQELANAELIGAHLAPVEHLPGSLRRSLDRDQVNEIQHLNAGALLIDAQLRRVAALSAQGEVGELESLLTAARVHNPEHVALNRTLAALSLEAGRMDAALDYLAAALRTSPRDALARKARAIALHRANRLAAAIGAYNLALAQRPDDAELLNGLGAAHAARGDFVVARRYFERALAVAPSYREAAENLERLGRR
jgi:spermidine synthase